MRNKLLFIFWLLATVGVTYVANTAVGLVDLQMFPNRTRIEVLTLSEPGVVSPDESESEEPLGLENKVDLTALDSENTLVETSIPLSIPASTTLVPLGLNEENLQNNQEEVLEILEIDVPKSDLEEKDEIITEIESVAFPEEELLFALEVLDESNTNSGEIEQPDEADEDSQVVAPVTTTTISETDQPEASIAPLAGVAMEKIELRVGADYRRKLITGGNKPYKTGLLEGELPNGLTVDENGEINGNPSKSGVFEAKIQISDSDNNSIQQLISFIVNEYRSISATGGSVTVIITGESVRFFSALNASGYESAAVTREGPLSVEVSFLPISEEDLSWVRCSVVDSSVECDKN
tara:strand:- start:161 stop:1213 length:1053 start_codon:yes stop_codon:yes gene_type:complete